MDKKTNAQKGKASKNKGKRFERQVAHMFQDAGIPAFRTAQYRGNTGQAGDVEGVEGIHIEAKAVEHLNLYAAFEQSQKDAAAEGKRNIPTVIFKKNRRPVMICLQLEDWLPMYHTWIKGGK